MLKAGLLFETRILQFDLPAKYRSRLTDNMHLCSIDYAQPDWHAQAFISMSTKIGKVCLIKKEVFLDQKYLFSVYKFYLPLNQSGY